MPFLAPLGAGLAGLIGGGSTGGIALGAGIGGALSGLGSKLGQNKVGFTDAPPPKALFPGLQQQYLQQVGGEGGFGAQSIDTLQEMSRTGMPVDIGPLFESLVSARERFTDIGRENILGQFGAAGLRFSQPLLTELTSFEGQTAKDYGQILAELSRASAESARGRQMQASGMGLEAFGGPALTTYPGAIPTVQGPGLAGSVAGGAISGFSDILKFLALRGMLGG